MDDEVADPGGRDWKHTTRTVMFTVPMLMLLWITCFGYKNSTMRCMETNSSEGSYIALLFGVVTVIFGLVCIFIGISIVAELAMDFSAWLQQDDTETTRNQEKEQATNCKIFVHTLAVMVSMLMLTGTIFNGYKLAAEVHEVAIYNSLTFLIGVISMAFGVIYFIIGISLVANSALKLSGRFHQTVDKSDALLDRQSEVKLTSVFCDLQQATYPTAGPHNDSYLRSTLVEEGNDEEIPQVVLI